MLLVIALLLLPIIKNVLHLDAKVKKWQPLPKSKDLGVLFKAAGTDKFSFHHYEQYYNEWLAPYQIKRGLKFLEIGTYEGKSLNAWRHYFTNASLILSLAYWVDMRSVRLSLVLVE